jgi:hypothetical protein
MDLWKVFSFSIVAVNAMNEGITAQGSKSGVKPREAVISILCSVAAWAAVVH